MPRPIRLALLVAALLASLLLWMDPETGNQWTTALCVLFMLVFAALPVVMLALSSPWRWRVMLAAALVLFITHLMLQHCGLLDNDYPDDNPMLALFLGEAAWCFSIVTGMLRSGAEQRRRN